MTSIYALIWAMCLVVLVAILTESYIERKDKEDK